MEIVSVAGPLPDVGDTTSHGAVDVAVHVTVPAPLCVSRTVCEGVCELNAVPVVTAPNRSDVLSSDIAGERHRQRRGVARRRAASCW